MNEQNHPWCSNTARDEAIRAAEDAVAAERTPLPDHRELPQAVAELRERVARLEDHFADASKMVTPPQPAPVPPATFDPGMDHDAQASEADGLRTERVTLEVTHCATKSIRDLAGRDVRGWLETFGESIRVVEESVALRSCEDVLGAFGHALKTCTAERDAALRDLDGAMRGNTRLTNDVAALKARVAELEAAAAPAANAGGEANQPQPPRGWLTEEERVVVEAAVAVLDQRGRTNIGVALDALLCRSTQPMVRRPEAGSCYDKDDAWIAAIRAAGGEVE